MGCYIYVWLENGNPQLQIVDAQTKFVCLNWSYKNLENGSIRDKRQIQKLFTGLLLLTCQQGMRNCRIFKTGPEHKQYTLPVSDKLAYTEGLPDFLKRTIPA